MLQTVSEALTLLEQGDVDGAGETLTAMVAEQASDIRPVKVLSVEQARALRKEYLEGTGIMRGLASKYGLTLGEVWDTLYRKDA